MKIAQEGVAVHAEDVERLLDRSINEPGDLALRAELMTLARVHIEAHKDEIEEGLKTDRYKKVRKHLLRRLSTLEVASVADLGDMVYESRYDGYDDEAHKVLHRHMVVPFDHVAALVKYYAATAERDEHQLEGELGTIATVYPDMNIPELVALAQHLATADFDEIIANVEDYSDEAKAATGDKVHLYNMARGNTIGLTQMSVKYRGYADALSVLPLAVNVPEAAIATTSKR